MVRGREFGDRLRTAIAAAGFSSRALAERVDWDEAKLSGLVNGKGGISDVELGVVLGLCGVNPVERDHLLSLFPIAHVESWLQEHGTCPPVYHRTPAENLAAANALISWRGLALPESLQTPAYMRAAIVALPNARACRVDQFADLASHVRGRFAAVRGNGERGVEPRVPGPPDVADHDVGAPVARRTGERRDQRRQAGVVDAELALGQHDEPDPLRQRRDPVRVGLDQLLAVRGPDVHRPMTLVGRDERNLVRRPSFSRQPDDPEAQHADEHHAQRRTDAPPGHRGTDHRGDCGEQWQTEQDQRAEQQHHCRQRHRHARADSQRHRQRNIGGVQGMRPVVRGPQYTGEERGGRRVPGGQPRCQQQHRQGSEPGQRGHRGEPGAEEGQQPRAQRGPQAG
ncbi:helix-turn-helix domain-containing protein [Lentzea sp.]|uniref:helix-turn-helix domain-containing protein n=1 Tax=Lentzea sp. TaxID=56099 RepID=UPI0039C8E055